VWDDSLIDTHTTGAYNMNGIQVNSKIKIVNFHGEDFALTNKLGFGYVKSFYKDCGEQRAEIFFPKVKKTGGYPIEMIKPI